LEIVSCFRDHHTAIGVSHQDHRTVLLREDELRRRDVVSQRRGRVLYDADAVPIIVQDLVDARPARAIHESAVNENDVELLRHDDPPVRRR